MTKGKEVPNLTQVGPCSRAHRAVPGRLDGSFRLSVGGPQADVLRSGGGREAETRFVKALYVPTRQLRHVLSSNRGPFISATRTERRSSKQLELIPGAVEDANRISPPMRTPRLDSPALRIWSRIPRRRSGWSFWPPSLGRHPRAPRTCGSYKASTLGMSASGVSPEQSRSVELSSKWLPTTRLSSTTDHRLK